MAANESGLVPEAFSGHEIFEQNFDECLKLLKDTPERKAQCKPQTMQHSISHECGISMNRNVPNRHSSSLKELFNQKANSFDEILETDFELNAFKRPINEDQNDLTNEDEELGSLKRDNNPSHETIRSISNSQNVDTSATSIKSKPVLYSNSSVHSSLCSVGNELRSSPIIPNSSSIYVDMDDSTEPEANLRFESEISTVTGPSTTSPVYKIRQSPQVATPNGSCLRGGGGGSSKGVGSVSSGPHVQFETPTPGQDDFFEKDNEMYICPTSKHTYLMRHPSNDGKDSDSNWLLSGHSRKRKRTYNTSCSSAGSDLGSTTSVLSESSELQRKAPDGGWGWIIVFASFLIHCIADGVTMSFGVIFSELLDQFKESKAFTSWVGSLFMAIPLLAGPLASVLTDYFGCRKVTIMGSVIACLGFLISAFADSIWTLLITMGLITGLGLAVCYVAAIVIVAFYFEKKRSLATGIAVAGSGIGTFVFAPFIQYLIENWGLKGSLIILAGVFLNMCVCGGVMRDLAWTRKKSDKISSSAHVHSRGESATHSSESLYDDDEVSTGAHSTCPTVNELRHIVESGDIAALLSPDDSPTKFVRSSSMLLLPTFLTKSQTIPQDIISCLSTQANAFEIISQMYPHLLSSSLCEQLNFLPSMFSETRLHEHPPLSENKDMTTLVTNNDQSDQFGPPSTMVSSLYEASTDDMSDSWKEAYACKASTCSMVTSSSSVVNSSTSNSISCCLVTSNAGFSTTNALGIHLNGINCTATAGGTTSEVKSITSKKCPLTSVRKVREMYRKASIDPIERIPDGTYINFQKINNHLSSDRTPFDNATTLTNRRNEITLDNGTLKMKQRHIVDLTSLNSYPLRNMKIRKQSMTYRGAMLNIHRYRLRASSCPDIYRNSMITINQASDRSLRTYWNDLTSSGRDCLDMPYCKDPGYLIFSLSNFILYLFYDTVYMYLVDYAQENGHGEEESANLISIIGILNCVGMIGMGYIGDKEWYPLLLIYNLSMVSCGMAIIFMPFLTSYIALSLLAALFGFFISANYALTSVILVELISLDSFTKAYGLLLLIQGMANLVGPPLVGFMRDTTNNYIVPFMVSGISIIGCGLMLFLIPIMKRVKGCTSSSLQVKCNALSSKESLTAATESPASAERVQTALSVC